MKGAHGAKGKCIRVTRKCVWEDIDASNVKRRKRITLEKEKPQELSRKIKGKRRK